MITSTTNEFESILRKKDWMELLKIKQQKNKVVVGLRKRLKIMRWNSATYGINCLLQSNEEMKTSFIARIGGNLDYW